MRDYETISAAVTAAETGHLVMSTLHTIGAAQTSTVSSTSARPGHRTRFAASWPPCCGGVITQQLLPLAVGRGRCAATEILVGTDAVRKPDPRGQVLQIPSILQSGAALWYAQPER